MLFIWDPQCSRPRHRLRAFKALLPDTTDTTACYTDDMTKHRNWSREETLLAFRLYCHTPFGKLHQNNPDIIRLAERIDRTPSAVAMKGCNFASLDPLHQQRGVTGLPNRSKLEDEIWREFSTDSETIAIEAEALHESFAVKHQESDSPVSFDPPEGPTETERTVRTRRVQGFFRKTILASYGNRCALTGLAMPQLLNASHIIPWAQAAEHRADPTNGICLNALHDRAFDRGLISFDERFRLLVSPCLADDSILGKFSDAFVAQTQLILPERFSPDSEALAYHRTTLYQAG